MPNYSPIHSCSSSPSASPSCSPTLSPSSTQQLCSSGSSSLSTTNSLNSSQKSAIPAPSKEKVEHFFTALACTSNKPAILSLVEPYSSSYIPKALNEDLPVCMSEIQKPEYLQYSYGELLKVAEQCTITITPQQAQTVESKTRLQSKSSLWFRMRCGRITASKFKSAAHTDPASPSLSLIMSVCHPELAKFKTVATTWGREHEKDVLAEYQSVHASMCKNRDLKV